MFVINNLKNIISLLFLEFMIRIRKVANKLQIKRELAMIVRKQKTIATLSEVTKQFCVYRVMKYTVQDNNDIKVMFGVDL